MKVCLERKKGYRKRNRLRICNNETSKGIKKGENDKRLE
jgi:hypothetical protein